MQALRIDGAGPLDAAALGAWAEQLPRLERLWFTGLVDLTPEGWTALASLGSVRDLALEGPLGLTDLQAASLGSGLQLERLRIHDAAQLTDRGLGSWLSGSPELRELDLAHCPEISAEGLGPVLECSRLQRLSAEFSNDCVEFVAALVDLPGLEELVLREVSDLTDEALAPLLALPRLRVLRLTHATQLTDDSLRRALTSSTLRHVGFLGSPQLSTDGLPQDGGRQVEILELPRTQLGDAAAPILSGYPRLVALDVRGGAWTFEGHRRLASIPQLGVLLIEERGPTDALRQAHPGLRILEY